MEDKTFCGLLPWYKNTSKTFQRILLFFHTPDPEISRTSSLRLHYIGRLSFPDLVFSLKYKFLLVLKYFPLGFFLPTSVSHPLPNPLIHTHTHTHTPPSLLQAQLLWTPLWLLQISTLPPAPAHTRDSGYRQTQCHPVTCLCSPSLHLHPRSGSTRVNAWLPQP